MHQVKYNKKIRCPSLFYFIFEVLIKCPNLTTYLWYLQNLRQGRFNSTKGSFFFSLKLIMTTIYIFIFKLENFNLYCHTLPHVCIFLCVYIDYSMDHAKGQRDNHIYIQVKKEKKEKKKKEGDKVVFVEEIQSMTHKEADSSSELIGFP